MSDLLTLLQKYENSGVKEVKFNISVLDKAKIAKIDDPKYGFNHQEDGNIESNWGELLYPKIDHRLHSGRRFT